MRTQIKATFVVLLVLGIVQSVSALSVQPSYIVTCQAKDLHIATSDERPGSSVDHMDLVLSCGGEEYKTSSATGVQSPNSNQEVQESIGTQVFVRTQQEKIKIYMSIALAAKMSGGALTIQHENNIITRLSFK